VNKPRFSTFELILLALFAALVVAAKVILRFPIRLPGHSGLFWMALVVVAMGIVPKLGAGSLVGVTSGLLAAFLGLGDFGALDTFLSYAFLGIVADLTGHFLGGVSQPAAAILAGGCGAVAKTLIKALLAWLLKLPAGFIAFGLLYSFLANLAFGLAGGFLGWLVLKALRRAGFFAYLAEKR
jgi:hypothetical protein